MSEPPRCLRVRDVAVWALSPGDELAPQRWRTAANRWRTQASAAGLSNDVVWHALPPGRCRANGDPQALDYALWAINCTADDLPTIAHEADELFPDLFEGSWTPEEHREPRDWHLAQLRGQPAKLRP